MVPERTMTQADAGVVPTGPGWHIVNGREVPWRGREGLGRWCDLEGEGEFEELGFQLVVLDPGVPACMYHGESDQEDFLVVSGECVLVIEGEKRQLKAWDFVHCPSMTEHVFVGAGDGPCVIVMVGARKPGGEIIYPVNKLAAKHGASVDVETPEPVEAYARFTRFDPSPYRDGDLPDF
jgi:uncharacterized cupin superfamily protein